MKRSYFIELYTLNRVKGMIINMNVFNMLMFILHIIIVIIININTIDKVKLIFFPYISTFFLLCTNHLIIVTLVMKILSYNIFYNILFLFIHLIILLAVLRTDKKIFYLSWFEMVEVEFHGKSIFKKMVIVNILLLINIIWLLFILLYFIFMKRGGVLLSILVLFSICFYILLLFYFDAIIRYNMISAEAITDKNYRKEVESYMNVIRSQRHDFNFHLHAISGMVSNGKLDECQQYINEMVNLSSNINDIIGIYDSAIAAMLNIFREKAYIEGINVDFDIRYSMENIGTPPYEVNKVIGNLLQNAIDETLRHKDFSYGIKILIFKRSGNTVIDVSNIFDRSQTNLEKIFQYGYSSKSNNDGIGLNTVLNILEYRKGIIYMEFEDNIIHFIVSIPNRYVDRRL